MQKIRKICFLGFILAVIAYTPQAFAVHGNQHTGYGAIQEAMAGTGVAASFKQSRANPAITGNNFDTFIDYRLFKLIPALAYSIMDNLSIGASVQMGYAAFGMDMMVSATQT